MGIVGIGVGALIGASGCWRVWRTRQTAQAHLDERRAQWTSMLDDRGLLVGQWLDDVRRITTTSGSFEPIADEIIEFNEIREEFLSRTDKLVGQLGDYPGRDKTQQSMETFHKQVKMGAIGQLVHPDLPDPQPDAEWPPWRPHERLGNLIKESSTRSGLAETT